MISKMHLNNSRSGQNIQACLMITNIAPKFHDCWILDSGASHHYTNNLNIMTNVRDINEIVLQADSGTIELQKCGDVILRSQNIDLTLKDVRWSHKFSTNLISISRLTKNHATVHFHEQYAKVTNNDKLIMSACRIGQLYVADVNNVSMVMLTKNDHTHARLGHMNFNSIERLAKYNAIQNLNLMTSEPSTSCAACQMGKSSVNQVKKYTSRVPASRLLQRVHADLCGPINIQNNHLQFLNCYDSPKYISVIIDEFSRKIFVQILSHKSLAYDHITNFIKQAEALKQTTLQEFCSDNGTEYKNNRLSEYFKSKGIKQTFSPVYSPHRNGMAERAVRTLTECTRSILYHAKLHVSFWPIAFETACYLSAFRIHVMQKQITVQEVWSGIKPSLNRLKVFGCDAWVHIPDEKRTKLDPKSFPAIFVGYSYTTEAAWRFYDFNNHKIIVSQNATFDESSFTFGRKEILKSMPVELDLELNQLPDSLNEQSSTILDQGATDEYEYTLNVPSDDEITWGTQTSPSYPAQNNATNSVNNARDLRTTSQTSSGNTDSITDNTQVPTRRSSRTRTPARKQGFVYWDDWAHYDMYEDDDGATSMLSVNIGNLPNTYEEAMDSEDADEWKSAIDREIQAQKTNGTWSEVEQKDDMHLIDTRWVFVKKPDASSQKVTYKARLVARGFQQKENQEYKDVYAPVMRFKSLKVLLSLSQHLHYQIFQIDFKTAYLNADLDFLIYIKPPKGVQCPTNKVLQLHKALYGLKQSGSLWNALIDQFITKDLLFKKTVSDPCIYQLMSKTEHKIYLGLFVDDIICCVHDDDAQQWFDIKSQLSDKFKLSDLGKLSKILGLHISYSNNKMQISQHSLIQKGLVQFRMDECKPIYTPQEPNSHFRKHEGEHAVVPVKVYQAAIGFLNYLSYGTRFDICYTTNSLSRFSTHPSSEHWQGVKRVLRYLQATKQQQLSYTKSKSQDITVKIYCDASWASNLDDRKSTTGILLKLNDNPILWYSKKQKTVALSTAEAELMAIASAVQESLWMRQFIDELTNKPPKCIIYTDNQAAIHMASNDSHKYAKHISIRYNFIKENLQSENVCIEYLQSSEQQADIFTKATVKPVFQKLHDLILNAEQK